MQNTKSFQEPTHISFDDLLKNPKMESHNSIQRSNHLQTPHSSNMALFYNQLHPQPNQNFNYHNNHHMNYQQPNGGHMQRGFSNQQQGYAYMQNQSVHNNFTHNPHIGYAPHGGMGGMAQQQQFHSYSPQPNQNGQYSNITLN